MKIFYLLFLVFLFMSCAERGNEEKKVMILGVTPEQIVEFRNKRWIWMVKYYLYRN